MKKILFTIASVLLVTAVVSAAYAQEADDGPISTARPDDAAPVNAAPSNAVAGAPPQPVVRFQFIGEVPANFNISQIQNRDIPFSEMPAPAQRLFIQGLSPSDRENDFSNFRLDPNAPTYRVSGEQFKGGDHPWDGLVQAWRDRPGNVTIEHTRLRSGHELMGEDPPKVWMIKLSFKH